MASSIRIVTALLGAVCLLASPAYGDRGYAGLTASQAVKSAENEVVAVGLAFRTLTPATAASLRHQLEVTAPTVTRSSCKGKPAWKIVWPRSTPIYIARDLSSTVDCTIKFP